MHKGRPLDARVPLIQGMLHQNPGAVDKFQEQVTLISIYSMATRSPDKAPTAWSFCQPQPTECPHEQGAMPFPW